MLRSACASEEMITGRCGIGSARAGNSMRCAESESKKGSECEDSWVRRWPASGRVGESTRCEEDSVVLVLPSLCAPASSGVVAMRVGRGSGVDPVITGMRMGDVGVYVVDATAAIPAADPTCAGESDDAASAATTLAEAMFTLEVSTLGVRGAASFTGVLACAAPPAGAGRAAAAANSSWLD